MKQKSHDNQIDQEENVRYHKWLDIVLIIIIIILLLLLIWFSYKLWPYLNKEFSNKSGDIFNITCDCENNGELEVFDSDIVWDEENELQIFKNPVYEMEEIIAPGSSNSYRFSIRNRANCNLEYELTFIENNPFDVNMKYRLMVNNQYVSTEWMDIEDISKIVEKLDNDSQDDYYLEWSWIESNNDTKVGSNIEAYYHLSIQVVGKQIV